MRLIGRRWCSVAWLLAIGGNSFACSSRRDEAGAGGLASAASGFTSAAGAGVGGIAVDPGGGRAGASAGSTNLVAGAGGVGGGVAAGPQGGGTAQAGARSGSAGSTDAPLAGAAGAATGPTSCEAPLSVGNVASVEATEQVETYAIMGTSANALRSSINANRGHEYDAQTDWYIRWSVKNCAAPQWTITLTIDYSVPDWEVPATADPVLVAQWRTYLSALYCHEYGHGELALDCANRIYDDLITVPGNDDCNVVTSVANARFQAILTDCQALEAAYDERTNHGASMGAIFPP